MANLLAWWSTCDVLEGICILKETRGSGHTDKLVTELTVSPRGSSPLMVVTMLAGAATPLMAFLYLSLRVLEYRFNPLLAPLCDALSKARFIPAFIPIGPLSVAQRNLKGVV